MLGKSFAMLWGVGTLTKRNEAEKEAEVMKRGWRMAGVFAVVIVLMSLFVMGCGDAPTAPITAGDGDGIYLPPDHAGGGPNVNLETKGSNNQQ